MPVGLEQAHGSRQAGRDKGEEVRAGLGKDAALHPKPMGGSKEGSHEALCVVKRDRHLTPGAGNQQMLVHCINMCKHCKHQDPGKNGWPAGELGFQEDFALLVIHFCTLQIFYISAGCLF